MTPGETKAAQIGREAGQQLNLNDVLVRDGQRIVAPDYRYHPFTDVPKPPAEIDPTRLWEYCPETRDMLPSEARELMTAYEYTVRVRFGRDKERY